MKEHKILFRSNLQVDQIRERVEQELDKLSKEGWQIAFISFTGTHNSNVIVYTLERFIHSKN